MPINASPQYQKSEEEYTYARTKEEKLAALHKMLSLAPKHKSAGPLLASIKTRISKIKKEIQKEKQQKKQTSTKKLTSVKKEGASQITLVGKTNSGKSTLLKQLTGAKVEIALYPFTTKKPEVGILDYKGVKIHVVEIPAIVKNFLATENGPTFMSIINHSDLIILLFKTPEEKAFLDKELYDVRVKRLIYDNSENFADKIWNHLNLIKVYTKQPGKKHDYPPVALKKGSQVRDLAEVIHKDFLKKFKYARIFGSSAKFDSQQVGLNHKLDDEDVVEIHLK
ncbi:MAG: TGS domain-containing protein [Candidatus Woesearchaeota archaeon]|nr:MAG: TGS domain-containing protein [Candidatus Woesearchaeota archaeon]